MPQLRPEPRLSIPNILSLARILITPVVIWLIIDGELQLACAAVLAAGLSDALDGFLAKRWKLETEFGAYLDPIADKLLLVSVFVALGIFGELPAWLVILAVSRDVMIVTAILLAYVLGQPMRVKPLFISKANTTAQILLALMTLADAGFGLGLGIVRFSLVWVTAVLTAISAAAYLRSWLQHMTAPAGATER